MAAVVSISGIDEAIKNLDYKAKDSAKLRLIRAIRAHYAGDSTLATLQAIDPDILVQEVWDTAFDDHRLRSRRKNLASIRSSVNADLKRLFENGKNPDGIIIGSSNTFVMSDEAKDQMLTSIAASVRKDGHVSLGQITRTLSVIDDLLAQTERFIKTEDDDRDSGIRRLKQLIEQISKRVDLDVKEGGIQGDVPGGPGSEIVGNGELIPEEVSAEDGEFEEMEVIEEPDDLEDLDEVIEEEDDSDVEPLEEARLAGSGNGEEFESGAGSGLGTEPSGGDQGMDRAAAPEMGLPLGSLGLDAFVDTNQNRGAAQEADRHLLAEAFDGYLGAMERFYNQYPLIPKGAYTVGGGHAALGHPERRVRLPEFYAGKFPVTNALFEIFVEKTGYLTTAEKEGYGVVYHARRKRGMDERTGRERVIWNAALVSQRVDGACWYQPLGPGSTLHRKRNHPVVQVSLEDAAAFAAWTGKRLPSEAEWEAAARSGDGRLYPWGDVWVDDRCNVEEAQVGDTTPVDAHLEAAGPFGIADTLGNVMEWTLDRDQTGENSHGPCYIVKGGSWASTSDICLCSRFKMDSDTRSNILGFRCVAS